MKLHSTQRWNPVSRKVAQQTLEHTLSLEPLLRELASSSLREELGLDNGVFEANPGWSLVGQFEAFREQLEMAAHRATERENQLFNEGMVWVIQYVVDQTGAFRDDDLTAIVRPMLSRPFSAVGWRKHHKSLIGHIRPPDKGRKKQVHRVARQSKNRP